MNTDYKEVLKATDTSFLHEARHHLTKRDRFVVIKVSPTILRDCKAFAQEFDYKLVIEDGALTRQQWQDIYPNRLPSKIGFIPKEAIKPISN